MKRYEDELSLRTFEQGEDAPHARGVVVCLSSHRHWRSRTHSDRPDDLTDRGRLFTTGESGKSLPPVIEREGESTTLREPSLWLAGSAAIILFGSIIGLYWAFLTAAKAVLALSIAQF
jgi:hypothetical protein